MTLRTIREASELVRTGEVSPVELVRECLEKIDELNPRLNAFITVTADSALQEGAQAEAEVRSGKWRGPLHGIPIGLKDLIDTAGVRTTAASAVFESRVPAEDAEVVRKLRAAGAIIVGKQNLHEFAYGGSSLISRFGPVRNPVNPEHIAGGSSGGSAAAVACGMCYASIGTDTAGSIREPAALCGVVGLKPSYGLVNKHGVIPLSLSLDHVGPITRTVEDAAILLGAIAEIPGNYRASLSEPLGRVMLGIPRKYFFDDLDASVAKSVDEAIAEFERLGFELREIDLSVETDRTVQMAEAYHYHRERIATSPGLYDPETLRRVLSGEKISDTAYNQALRALEKGRNEIAKVKRLFDGIDALVMPTTPVPAPRISDLMEDPAKLRPAELMLLRNTRWVNVLGLPAISVPCGFSAEGLPIGLQIVGSPQRDSLVLRIAHAFERVRA
jgi:aspartyl-tRNA(Asn)/glutamyl-tRNA(Gln) amidotransferase subunit A